MASVASRDGWDQLACCLNAATNPWINFKKVQNSLDLRRSFVLVSGKCCQQQCFKEGGVFPWFVLYGYVEKVYRLSLLSCLAPGVYLKSTFYNMLVGWWFKLFLAFGGVIGSSSTHNWPHR